MRKVILGHAYCDENGGAKGGKAGNQSGRELRFQDWYNRSKGWTHVFRAKDPEVRRKLAEAMTAAVNNKKIGYDQGQRTTLYDEAEKKNFDLGKIKKACETDCSALVSVCINAAGIPVSKDMYTGNELSVLKKTKAFEIFTDKEYTASPDKLEAGDILLGEGHTAIITEVQVTNEPAKTTMPVKKPEKKTYFRVQVAACKNLSSAESYAIMVRRKGFNCTILNTGDYYRCVEGDYLTKEEANSRGKALNSASIPTYIYNVTR